MSRRRVVRASVGFALVLFAALAGVVRAEAAGLALDATSAVWHSQVFARTCAGPAQVRPSGSADGNGRYTHVAVTGLTGTCGTGYLGLRTASGTVLANGTAPVSGGGFTLTVPAFTPPSSTDGKAVVTVDTWPVAATWAPPTNPLGTCVAVDSATGLSNGTCTIVAITNDRMWGDTGKRSINLQVSLLGTAPVNWRTQQYEVVLNLAGVVPSDWTWSTSGVTGSGSGWAAAPGSRCSDLPLLHVYAPAWAWDGSKVYMRLDESRSGSGSGALCS